MSPYSQYLGQEGVEQLMSGDLSGLLGEEGVQQIMSGDFSKLQDLGKKVLGEDGSQVVRTILDNIPEGTFGSQDDGSEEDK